MGLPRLAVRVTQPVSILARGTLRHALFGFSCAISACALVLLYTRDLADVPPYLVQDEAGLGLGAYLLATTGRDYFGNLLPPYVGYLDNHQLGGALVAYWAIPFIKAIGLSVETIRLSMATLGLLSVAASSYLAWTTLHNRWLALLGAWLLGTTPIFFMQSRVFLEVLMPVPFVVGWLICVQQIGSRRANRALLLAAAALGIGFYAYGTARAAMPMYLGLTLVLVLISRRCSWRAAAAAGLVFGSLMVPALVMAAGEPALYVHRFQELTWLRGDMEVQEVVATFLRQYAAILSPSDLFVHGDSSLVHSTGRAGAFLASTFPLALAGIVRLVRRSASEREPLHLLLPIALALSPVPIALIAELHAPARATYAAPIYLALCLVGAKVLVEGSSLRRLGRGAFALVLATMAFEAVAFFADYFTAYPARSVAQLEFNGNKPGGFRALLALGAGEKQVYYDVEDAATTTFARFFRAEAGYDGEVFPAPPEWRDRLPPGALLLTARPSAYGHGFQVVSTIPEFAPGREPPVVLRRVDGQ